MLGRINVRVKQRYEYFISKEFIYLYWQFRNIRTINSFGYKFCSVKELLTTNTVDMLIIAETKLDNTFINSQFAVDNYHLWRADRNSRGGGLLVYIRSDLACDRKNNIECGTIESI